MSTHLVVTFTLIHVHCETQTTLKRTNPSSVKVQKWSQQRREHLGTESEQWGSSGENVTLVQLLGGKINGVRLGMWSSTGETMVELSDTPTNSVKAGKPLAAFLTAITHIRESTLRTLVNEADQQVEELE